MLRALAVVVAVALSALGALVAWWGLRPNRARVDPRLGLASWDLVADGEHDSNTDLIVRRGVATSRAVAPPLVPVPARGHRYHFEIPWTRVTQGYAGSTKMGDDQARSWTGARQSSDAGVRKSP
jgi:hypothetical protein